jgi:hypothetical protein
MAPHSFGRSFTHSSLTPAAGDEEIDLPDPLDGPEEQPAGDSADLLSQLAGDAVNRMMGDGPPDPAPAAESRLNPVQELTSQLDTFFEELRERQAEAAAVVDAIPEAQTIVIDPAERAALRAMDDINETNEMDEVEGTPPPPPRRDLLETHKPVRAIARPLHWCGGLIESLSPGARGVINVTAILSFLAACAALAYVLMLRHG